MSNPFAWPAYPWNAKPTENDALAVQKALNDARGPVFFPNLLSLFNGVIPAGQWKNGGKVISETYNGFVRGFNARSYLASPDDFANEGLLLTWSISGGMHESRRTPLGAVNRSVSGAAFMFREIPFLKKAILFWKVENTNSYDVNLALTVPFDEIRR